MSLKLETGKCYKTRDGRKAFISDIAETNASTGIIEGDVQTTIWKSDGRHLCDLIRGDNIVSERQDTPETKFKVGSKWEFTDEDGATLYTVDQEPMIWLKNDTSRINLSVAGAHKLLTPYIEPEPKVSNSTGLKEPCLGELLDIAINAGDMRFPEGEDFFKKIVARIEKLEKSNGN